MDGKPTYMDLSYPVVSTEPVFSPHGVVPLPLETPDYERLKLELFDNMDETLNPSRIQEPLIFGRNLKQEQLPEAISPPFFGFTDDGSEDEPEAFVPLFAKEQEMMKLERKRERNRLAAAKCRRKKLERIDYEENRILQLSREIEYLEFTCAKLEKEISHMKYQVWEHLKKGCVFPHFNKFIP